MWDTNETMLGSYGCVERVKRASTARKILEAKNESRRKCTLLQLAKIIMELHAVVIGPAPYCFEKAGHR